MQAACVCVCVDVFGVYLSTGGCVYEPVCLLAVAVMYGALEQKGRALRPTASHLGPAVAWERGEAVAWAAGGRSNNVIKKAQHKAPCVCVCLWKGMPKTGLQHPPSQYRSNSLTLKHTYTLDGFSKRVRRNLS